MKNVFFIFVLCFVCTFSFAQSLRTNIRVAKDATATLPEPMDYNISIDRVDKTITLDCLDCELDIVFDIDQSVPIELIETSEHLFEIMKTTDGEHVVVMYNLNGEIYTIGFKQFNGVSLYYLFDQSLDKTYKL